MTKANATKTAETQARCLRTSYAVLELATGEFIPLRLPFKVISIYRPAGESDAVEVQVKEQTYA